MSRNKQTSLFSANSISSSPHCPECGSLLQPKQGKFGLFLGCSHYPECRFIQPIKAQDGRIIKELGVACPSCEHELLLRKGRYGIFVGCSNYPQCQYLESLTAEEESRELIDCPECQKGQLVERNSRFGKRFFACDGYPSCRFTVNYHPVAGVCEICGFALLMNKNTDKPAELYCARRQCQHKQTTP